MSSLLTPPCYKYIARNLATPEGRYEFSKHFFDKMVSTGANQDECLVLYSSFEFPPEAGSAYSYNGVDLRPQDYYEHILGLEDIPSVSCPQYYRGILKPNNLNNLCQLCELSKSYKNRYYSMECSILKYVVSSRDNLIAFNDLDLGAVFVFVVDIASELSFPAPAVVQILSLAYSEICNHPDDVYLTEDIRERLGGLVGRITVGATKNKNVKEVQMSNHKALPVAWELAINDVLSADDVTLDDILSSELVADVQKSAKKKKSGKKKKALVQDNPLFDYLDELYAVGEKDVVSVSAETIEPSIEVDPPVVEDMPIIEPAEPDVPTDIPMEVVAPDDIPEINLGVITEDAYDGDIPESAFQSDEPSDDEIGEDWDGAPEIPDDIPPAAFSESSDNEDMSAEASDEPEQKAEDGNVSDETIIEEVTAVEENVDDASDVSEQSDDEPELSEGDVEAETEAQTEQSPVKALKYKVPEVKEGSLIYSIIVNRKALKNYAHLYKNVEKDVFVSIQKSKRLPVEVVYDEDNSAVLVMFVRNMGEFVYCPIDAMPNSLIALMLSKSVIKICYQPYYLYSLLRIYGVRASGVYSICTMDNMLHPEAVISYYEDFFDIYRGDFRDIPSADSGFPDFDCLLCNMQKYILVHARQTRERFNKEEYVKRHARDEVLGSSFLRAVNLKSNDYLFTLEPNGKVVYAENYEQLAKSDGFFVTYSVGAEDLGELTAANIYLDALYELSSKGRFRKYNIQLITITRTAMVLFIGESEYELITTALQKYFNRYAIQNHIEKFELNVAHQRVYVNTQKGAKQYQIPKTYEQAMDLLITTNDTVSVSENHVVKRSKTQRKRQNKQFKPNS